MQTLYIGAKRPQVSDIIQSIDERVGQLFLTVQNAEMGHMY